MVFKVGPSLRAQVDARQCSVWVGQVINAYRYATLERADNTGRVDWRRGISAEMLFVVITPPIEITYMIVYGGYAIPSLT